MKEQERIAFLLKDRGYDETFDFAVRTYNTYKKLLLKKTPYAKAYRLELVQSCVYLRKFIRTKPE